MKKQAAEKEESEIADTGMRRVLAIYRSCRTQVRDSKIAPMKDKREISCDDEEAAGFGCCSFSSSPRWRLVGAFYFDPADSTLDRASSKSQRENFHAQCQPFWRLADTRLLGWRVLGSPGWRGSKKWIRIFAAMLLACATCRRVGACASRSRPVVRGPRLNRIGWNGPRFSSKYHAFPSGHTAASTAFFAHIALCQLATRSRADADPSC